MSIFRIEHNDFEKKYNALHPETIDETAEWTANDVRADEPSWIERYKYEANIIAPIIIENNYHSILEIGAGCGKLSTFIHPLIPYDLKYHLVDRPTAKTMFEKRGYKGVFFSKDISLDLDKNGLELQYDLFICNDVLEHLLAPTNIVKRVREMMTPNSLFLVSVPNWRMAHQFIYRGVWDYDNFVYFMYAHGFIIKDVYPSPLQTPYYPKLSSEESMPDELLQSWNFYFVCCASNNKAV